MGSLRLALGTRIRELRLAAGLTQPALAQKINMDYKNLAAIERGRRNVTIDLVERILQALGVAPEQLWPAKGKNGPVPTPEVALLAGMLSRLDSQSRRSVASLVQTLLKSSKKQRS